VTVTVSARPAPIVIVLAAEAVLPFSQ
jgi:hypothetical protein